LALIRHGVCLTAMQRFVEAEPKLLKAAELMAALDGPMNGRSNETCRALVGLYER